MSERKLVKIIKAEVTPWGGGEWGVNFEYEGEYYSGHRMASLQAAQRQTKRVGERVWWPLNRGGPPEGEHAPKRPLKAA